MGGDVVRRLWCLFFILVLVVSCKTSWGADIRTPEHVLNDVWSDGGNSLVTNTGSSFISFRVSQDTNNLGAGKRLSVDSYTCTQIILVISPDNMGHFWVGASRDATARIISSEGILISRDSPPIYLPITDPSNVWYDSDYTTVNDDDAGQGGQDYLFWIGILR